MCQYLTCVQTLGHMLGVDGNYSRDCESDDGVSLQVHVKVCGSRRCSTHYHLLSSPVLQTSTMAICTRSLIICLFLMSVVCGSLLVDALPSSLEGHDDRSGVHWALIVAGSNGWDNYRHQVLLLVLSKYWILHYYIQILWRTLLLIYPALGTAKQNVLCSQSSVSLCVSCVCVSLSLSLCLSDNVFLHYCGHQDVTREW